MTVLAAHGVDDEAWLVGLDGSDEIRGRITPVVTQVESVDGGSPLEDLARLRGGVLRSHARGLPCLGEGGSSG